MSHARTCVVTINYKGASDTVACITSLHASSVPVSIVVVDNTPDDPDLIDALKSYPEVKLIRAPENLGFGRGNNLGIEWALRNSDCENILLFNNDATVEQDAIEKLERVMDEIPTVGIATGRIVLADRPDILWYGGGNIDWRRGGGRIPGFNGSSDSKLALRSREVEFVSGCAMLVRRDVFEQIGGFDPVFFMYEEDVDLSIRTREAGYKLFYCAEAVLSHRVQGSQRKKSDPILSKWSPMNPNFNFHVLHMVRNSIINIRKHAKIKNYVSCFVIYPLFLLVKTATISRVRGINAFIPLYQGLRDGLTLSLKDKRRCRNTINRQEG